MADKLLKFDGINWWGLHDIIRGQPVFYFCHLVARVRGKDSVVACLMATLQQSKLVNLKLLYWSNEGAVKHMLCHNCGWSNNSITDITTCCIHSPSDRKSAEIPVKSVDVPHSIWTVQNTVMELFKLNVLRSKIRSTLKTVKIKNLICMWINLLV